LLRVCCRRLARSAVSGVWGRWNVIDFSGSVVSTKNVVTTPSLRFPSRNIVLALIGVQSFLNIRRVFIHSHERPIGVSEEPKFQIYLVAYFSFQVAYLYDVLKNFCVWKSVRR